MADDNQEPPQECKVASEVMICVRWWGVSLMSDKQERMGKEEIDFD